jgi:hypothetical protein
LFIKALPTTMFAILRCNIGMWQLKNLK